MVKQHILQAFQSAGTSGDEGEELADVVDDDIFETYFAGFVKTDEFGVDTVGADAGAGGKYTFAFFGYIAFDVTDNVVGKERTAVAYCLEDTCIRFFFASKCGEFNLALGIIVPAGNPVKFNL